MVESMTAQPCESGVRRPDSARPKRPPRKRPRRRRRVSANPGGGRAVSMRKTYCRHHASKETQMSHHQHATLLTCLQPPPATFRIRTEMRQVCGYRRWFYRYCNNLLNLLPNPPGPILQKGLTEWRLEWPRLGGTNREVGRHARQFLRTLGRPSVGVGKSAFTRGRIAHGTMPGCSLVSGRPISTTK